MALDGAKGISLWRFPLSFPIQEKSRQNHPGFSAPTIPAPARTSRDFWKAGTRRYHEAGNVISSNENRAEAKDFPEDLGSVTGDSSSTRDAHHADAPRRDVERDFPFRTEEICTSIKGVGGKQKIRLLNSSVGVSPTFETSFFHLFPRKTQNRDSTAAYGVIRSPWDSTVYDFHSEREESRDSSCQH
ncbi:hypothetical protein KM043_005719 [Ampulex compressa]|nr:hypothetical protein KM043_005719 [Ampulex compressa]